MFKKFIKNSFISLGYFYLKKRTKDSLKIDI